jgi:hypothetical protein
MRHTVKVITMVKKLAAVAVVFFAMGNGFAHATFIDFDELPYDPEHPEFYAHPVTDQYASQGLMIDGGFLMQYDSSSEAIISSPNYLLAGIGMHMSFLGAAPTFISLHVNSWRQEVIYFDFYGDSGHITTLKTKGYAGPHDDVPYEPNQFISLAVTEGIRGVYVNGFYSRSTAGEIDDLTFTYGVPEPSPLLLLGVGLGLVLIMRRRQKWPA